MMKSRHKGKSDVPKGYDPGKYPRPSVTTDVVLFTVRDGELLVLLIKRKHKPCAGMWAFPGGFVNMDEGLDEGALRELKEETDLDGIYIEQLHTYGNPDRDPRTRVITIAYIGMAPFEKLAPRSGDDAADAQWHRAHRPPRLAFDHDEILADALDRLKKRILEAPVALEFLPDKFTITQLRSVFEAVLDKPMDPRVVRRRIEKMGSLEPAGNRKTRRAVLYRFTPSKK